MFLIDKLLPEYRNLLGWKQYYNAAALQIDDELTATYTGEYFQSKHPAMRLNYIQAILPDDQDLSQYLREKIDDGIAEMFNDLLQYRQLSDYGKTLLEQAQLLNRPSFIGDRIMNQNRFVGFQIKVRDVTGLQTVVNEIGLQLTGADNIDLYLFHSQYENPVQVINVQTLNTSVTWIKTDTILAAMSAEEYHGGVFVLGYYQEDLSTQAINYSNFNWTKGECGGCNNSYYGVWQSIRKHFYVYPIYMPNGGFVKGKMFDLKDATPADNQSWGLNMKMTVRCDLTGFFIQNKVHFKNLLALKVVHMILNEMKFSQQINFIEENLKMMIIRDLEGDKETNALNISQQYSKELKAVTFNISGINNRCLDQKEDVWEPVIGAL